MIIKARQYLHLPPGICRLYSFYMYMRGSRGGSGGSGPPPPPHPSTIHIAAMPFNEKNSYFSYLCTSTVIRQGWTPPGKIFWIRAWCIYIYTPNYRLVPYIHNSTVKLVLAYMTYMSLCTHFTGIQILILTILRY